MAESGEIVEPVRIDHAQAPSGSTLVGLVMVDHDDVEAELARFGQRLDGWWCRNRP